MAWGLTLGCFSLACLCWTGLSLALRAAVARAGAGGVAWAGNRLTNRSGVNVFTALNAAGFCEGFEPDAGVVARLAAGFATAREVFVFFKDCSIDALKGDLKRGSFCREIAPRMAAGLRGVGQARAKAPAFSNESILFSGKKNKSGPMTALRNAGHRGVGPMGNYSRESGFISRLNKTLVYVAGGKQPIFMGRLTVCQDQ